MIGCEPSGRDHAVDMGMEQQVLSPCVKDREEADIGSHVYRVGRHLQQRLRCRREQQIVEHCRAGERQNVQSMRHGEDNVEVAGVE